MSSDPAETQIFATEGKTTSIEEANSIRTTLADLCAKGTSNYSRKNYVEASDYYAQAAELQAELNGEMSPENAEILFLYGRSLFKVGQSKSDVLGGRAGGEKQKSNKSKTKPAKTAPKADPIAEEGVAAIAEKATSEDVKPEPAASKPLFQFTGDENFEDSDDEEDDAAEEEEDEEEEEDDLAAAFELLDLARVFFTRKLEQPEESEDKGKVAGDSLMTKHIKERLSDTHDLLAEISLENERYVLLP
jgi:HAT1-interacting factor 1